jgi:hypothetical protein
VHHWMRRLSGCETDSQKESGFLVCDKFKIGHCPVTLPASAQPGFSRRVDYVHCSFNILGAMRLKPHSVRGDPNFSDHFLTFLRYCFVALSCQCLLRSRSPPLSLTRQLKYAEVIFSHFSNGNFTWSRFDAPRPTQELLTSFRNSLARSFLFLTSEKHSLACRPR